jgi:hypothetical protein
MQNYDDKIYKGVTGKCSLQLEKTVSIFAISKNMTIDAICFPLKDIHNTKWASPDANVSNQTDHTLIKTRRASNIYSVSSHSSHCITITGITSTLVSEINT